MLAIYPKSQISIKGAFVSVVSMRSDTFRGVRFCCVPVVSCIWLQSYNLSTIQPNNFAKKFCKKIFRNKLGGVSASLAVVALHAINASNNLIYFVRMCVRGCISEGGAKIVAKKFSEKSCKKIWSVKINDYLCTIIQ